MYEAIIAPLTNVRNHPNADRIKLATVAGHQVIVGLDAVENTLGAFFPPEGKLSYEMLSANNLYRKDPKTGKEGNGFFEKNGRVRTQKFRGERSEGFWVPLDYLYWTKVNKGKLIKGYTFTKLNNKLVCEKYYTPRTMKSMQKNVGRTRVKNSLYPNFRQHYDTKQLMYYIDDIPYDALIIISEKLHGTSGHTAHTLKEKPKKWYHKLFGLSPKRKWGYVSGSRRVVLDFVVSGSNSNSNSEEEKGFYKGTVFREAVHNKIKEMGLHKGETLYYEIVGFTDQKTSIMSSQQIEGKIKGKDGKNLVNQYGTNMVYSYGHEPEEDVPYSIYVYRITMTNEDGVEIDLSWQQIVERCKQLGLNHVPVLGSLFYKMKSDTFLAFIEQYLDTPSIIDDRHIREGVVIRVESPKMFTALKHKGYSFKLLEGILKEDDNYIDMEEAS